jgi:steroid delta-isomerase-like uncharacterized protein
MSSALSRSVSIPIQHSRSTESFTLPKKKFRQASVSARRSWEIVNQHNPDLIDGIYGTDFVWHEPDQDIRGSEEARQFVTMFFDAFPDLNVTVEDEIAEGDKVVTRWTIRGTHQGDLEGIAPTGKQIVLQGITIHRIEGDKIVEEWERYDNLGLMQQLGVVSELEQGRS